MNRQELLKRIKQTIRKIEPKAEIILYGPRVHEEAAPESAWEFMILLAGALTDERADRIRNRLYELEWESQEIISSIVRTKAAWRKNLAQAMPFYQQIEEEGIRL